MVRSSATRSLLPAIPAAVVVALVHAGPAGADPVSVRAAAHEDYGRVVFNWPSPVTFSATLEGRVLTVRFGRPIEASYGAAIRQLGKYIAGATPGDDGRSVRFSLKGDFGLRNFDMGRAVVVDLIDEAEAAERPTTAATADRRTPAAATAGPKVNVRTGQHKDYTRIVFDWPSKVGYRLDEGAASATVHFDRPARIDLERLKSRPPRYVSGASATASGGGVAVRLSVPPTSRIRHFLSGPKVVVDVMSPGTKKAVEKEPAPPPPAAQVAARAEAPTATGEDATAGLAKTTEATEKATPGVSGASAQGAAADRSAQEGAATDRSAQGGTATGAAPAPATTSAAPAKPSKPTLLLPGRRRGDSSPRPEAASTAATAGTDAQGAAGAAPAAPVGDAIGIRFDWSEPVAAAVFRRAGGLWIVFDKPSTQDAAALAAQAGNIVREIREVPAEQATALRIDTVSGVNPNIRRDGFAWILEFRKQALIASTPIETRVRANVAKGSRVFLPVREPGPAIAIADPEVGDTLVVVPVILLGHGIDRQRAFPQFRLLQTMQGVVVEPRIDNLLVKSMRRGVELTSPSRLQVSAVTARDRADAQLGAQRELTRLFDLKKWVESTPANSYAERRKLEEKISKAKSRRQEKRRFDLARFFFSTGYSAEAIGIMRVMEKIRPDLLNNPEFRAMRGAARLMMGHLLDAGADLYHPSLQDNDEARFWQAILRAREGDMQGAARFLRHLGGIIRPYPKALKVPLGLLVAEGGIALGSVRTARTYLDLVEAENPGPAERAELGYVAGRLAELSGDPETAVSEWEQVQTGPNRPSRAKATKARTELLLKKKEMSPAEAIEEFEKLRFAWRGDDFEFDVLLRLGELYMDVADYRNGLRTLRQAATHFRTHKKAGEVTQKMADSFASLYLDDAADLLAPVTAIALYDEFRELTPPGKRGDLLVRKLAERLVAIDLLDRAAKLLQTQIEFRLAGVERADVGTELANVHILNREPEKALQILKETEDTGMPPEMVEGRRLLAATALHDLKRTSEALTLLKEDKSVGADLLRVDFYWASQDWANTAQALRRLVRAFKAEPGEPIDDQQAETILNLATTLTLSGNQRAINRLRKDYGAAMDESPFRDAFRLIAGAQSLGLVDFRTIGGKVAQAENFQGFMAAYRERLKEEQESLPSGDAAGG